jgi:hypothetical protein
VTSQPVQPCLTDTFGRVSCCLLIQLSRYSQQLDDGLIVTVAESVTEEDDAGDSYQRQDKTCIVFFLPNRAA